MPLPDIDWAVALDALAAGRIPPDLVWVRLHTPVGDAVIDPGAPAQDSATKQVIDALGITVSFGTGPAPVPETTIASTGYAVGVGTLVLGGAALVGLMLKGGSKRKKKGTR